MLYALTLCFTPGITASQHLELLRNFSNLEQLVMHPAETLSHLNESVRVPLVKSIEHGRQQAMEQAREQLQYCQTNNIKVLPYHSPQYPERLRNCHDAPPLLYHCGSASLNAPHVLAIVGTRHISEYGKQLCHRLTEELQQLLPDVVVVSGLAYGVDIHAHRGSIEHGLATIGVVAHGLDQIYPATHRNDAKRMTQCGGIVTEYPRGTRPLQGNFLRRNRIIAGMADAVIVVESATHGGSLVTARCAESYQRQVFAFPGRTNDPYSAGCNELIRANKAKIALGAEDIVRELGWWESTTAYLQQPQQLELFAETDLQQPHDSALPAEQQLIVKALIGTDGLLPNAITQRTQLSAAAVSAALFDMEMDGIVRILPGGLYILSK